MTRLDTPPFSNRHHPDSRIALQLWQSASGQKLRSLGNLGARVASVRYVQDGKTVFAGAQNGSTAGWAAASGVSILPSQRLGYQLSALAVDPGATRVATASGDSLALYDLMTGRELSRWSIPTGNVTGLLIDEGGKHVLSGSSDGKLRIWEEGVSGELLQVTFAGNGWIAMDNQGRFDGSEDGIDNVSWMAGGGEIPLERFSPEFFDGGLVQAYWSGENDLKSPAPPSAGKGNFPLPPMVEIDDLPTAREPGGAFVLIAVATDQGGGIGPIHLYHNGKLVRDGAVIQQRDIDSDGKHLRAVAFHVTPTPGPNTFKAVAPNNWGIEGHSKIVTDMNAGFKSYGTIHVISVGVSHYKDTRLNLDFSAADATSFLSQVKAAAATIASPIDEHLLLDSSATTSNIKSILSSFRDVSEQDVIILYLSGHGLAIDNDWIFVPYEAKYSTDEEDYVGRYITASQIRNALVDAKAQRVLLVIDSCYSGAGVKRFDRYDALQRRYMRDVSRSAGITVMAAAKENQKAVELEKIGHGLFTYVVMSGLSGKARIQNNTKGAEAPVTAHELVRYTNREIGSLADYMHGFVQNSTGYALGADFVLRK